MENYTPNSNKILIVCGPTASGKTTLAIKLAHKFNGDVLVADSRQVYKQMDIVTGKDIPEGSKWHVTGDIGYWETRNKVRIWLTDIVGPKQSFSVSKWRENCENSLAKILKAGRRPIVCGGTGLYIESLVKNLENIDIPPNNSLREKMKNKTRDELFDILAHNDPVRAASLNHSDKNNPRRLMRAIEVSLSKRNMTKIKLEYDFCMIGLLPVRSKLFSTISRRVKERIKNGAFGEVERLIKEKVSWDAQSMEAIGYSQLKKYFLREKSRIEAINDWIKEEQKYALRQISWFRRYKGLNWFDPYKKDFVLFVEKLVSGWYNR